MWETLGRTSLSNSNRHHHERNRGRSLLDGEGGRRTGGHNHIDLQGDQLCDESGKPFILSRRPSILNLAVRALDVTQVTQSLAEWLDEIGLEGGGGVPEEAYPIYPLRLLCLRGGRGHDDAQGERKDGETDLLYHISHAVSPMDLVGWRPTRGVANGPVTAVSRCGERSR
jgi:hypothetical protein